MRRRAVLVVEYTTSERRISRDNVIRERVPDAITWERRMAGDGIKNVRVEVQEDKAWP